MFDVAATLRGALGAARTALDAAASETAREQALDPTRATDATMALVAQRALFTEALLGAVHARLAELKAVTR
ncbi:MAG: hypothetical protein ACYDEW_07085 [Vulcanimicrobiaceae bacterium]